MHPLIVSCSLAFSPSDPMLNEKGFSTAVGASSPCVWMVDARQLAEEGRWLTNKDARMDTRHGQVSMEWFAKRSVQLVTQAAELAQESLPAEGQTGLKRKDPRESVQAVTWQKRSATTGHGVVFGPRWDFAFDPKILSAQEASAASLFAEPLKAAFEARLEEAFGSAALRMDLLHDEPSPKDPLYERWARARDQWFEWWSENGEERPKPWRKGANPVEEHIAMLEAKILQREVDKAKPAASGDSSPNPESPRGAFRL